MIKAKAHQQQPPRAANCTECGEGFNNSKRLLQHLNAKHKEVKDE